MKSLAILIALLLSGCAFVKLSPEARQVRVISPSVAAATGCQFLGMNSARGVAIEGGMQAAQVKIRNQVAAAGGNAMVITDRNLEQMGQSTHGNITVDAYRCP